MLFFPLICFIQEGGFASDSVMKLVPIIAVAHTVDMCACTRVRTFIMYVYATSYIHLVFL